MAKDSYGQNMVRNRVVLLAYISDTPRDDMCAMLRLSTFVGWEYTRIMILSLYPGELLSIALLHERQVHPTSSASREKDGRRDTCIASVTLERNFLHCSAYDRTPYYIQPSELPTRI
jgi:hypothetical protein